MQLNDRILAVDDNNDNLMILEELLADQYTIMGVSSGEEAIQMAPVFRPDLVLLDVMMPGLDGIETCKQLQALPELKGTRIVMLSAKHQLQDRLAAYDVGAVDYIAKPFDHYEVMSKVRAWMQMMHNERVEDIWRAADLAQSVVGEAMLNMAAFRDTETGDHLFRVRWYAQALAEELSVRGPYQAMLDREFRECLFRASPLHDIGKVAIDDAILRKPGKLTTEEFEAMKKHTLIGAELLRGAFRKMPSAKYLDMAADIARFHHERFDGSGYPEGRKAAAIPLAARILAVADVFDALTTKRVYKEAVSFPEAAAEIHRGSGKHFDPAVVEAFQSQLDSIRQAYTRFTANCGAYETIPTPARMRPDVAERDTWFSQQCDPAPDEIYADLMLSAH